MTEPLDLDPIQARHQAATGGHWYVNRGSYDDPNFVVAEHHGYAHGVGSFDFGEGDEAEADREFILNAHTDIASLLAEIDRLCAELDGRDAEARERWIQNQEKQLGIKYADFRAGRWEMDLAMGREMAAAYVAMAKTLLGDAPNYSETKLEFDVKIAEQPELYTLVVQRHEPGAFTPHEARQRAERERDDALAELDRARAELATLAAIFEGFGRLLATSSRDWGTYAPDAWLYAVICGWDCEETEHNTTCVHGAMEEIAGAHGWDGHAVAKARRYRAAVLRLAAAVSAPTARTGRYLLHSDLD